MRPKALKSSKITLRLHISCFKLQRSFQQKYLLFHQQSKFVKALSPPQSWLIRLILLKSDLLRAKICSLLLIAQRHPRCGKCSTASEDSKSHIFRTFRHIVYNPRLTQSFEMSFHFKRSKSLHFSSETMDILMGIIAADKEFS